MILYLSRSSKTNGFLNRNSFNEYFKKLDKRCNFPEQEGFIFFRPYNLQKWFGNQLKKIEIGYTDTRHLMGNLIYDPTGQTYLKPDLNISELNIYKNMN